MSKLDSNISPILSFKSTGPQPLRDGSIDLLRALLVIYVVAYLHLGSYIGDGERHVHWSTAALTNVVLGTFTFLSGYVLGIWKGDTSISALGQFYLRRIVRIYPLYLLALTGFVVFWLVDMHTAVKAAFAISMFWPQPPMTLWFITMIIVCYLLAPAISIPAPRLGLLMAVLLWLVMLLFNFTIHEVDPRMLTQFPAFVAGISCRRFGLRSSFHLQVALLTGLFAASLVAALATLNRPLLGAIVAVPSVVFGPLVLLVVADRHFTNFGRHRVIIFLSYVSFTAYLFHRIVFEIIRRMLWPASEWAQLGMLLAIGLPVLLTVSALIQSTHDYLIASVPGLSQESKSSPVSDSSSR